MLIGKITSNCIRLPFVKSTCIQWEGEYPTCNKFVGMHGVNIVAPWPTQPTVLGLPCWVHLMHCCGVEPCFRYFSWHCITGKPLLLKRGSLVRAHTILLYTNLPILIGEAQLQRKFKLVAHCNLINLHCFNFWIVPITSSSWIFCLSIWLFHISGHISSSLFNVFLNDQILGQPYIQRVL